MRNSLNLVTLETIKIWLLLLHQVNEDSFASLFTT